MHQTGGNFFTNSATILGVKTEGPRMGVFLFQNTSTIAASSPEKNVNCSDNISKCHVFPFIHFNFERKAYKFPANSNNIAERTALFLPSCVMDQLKNLDQLENNNVTLTLWGFTL